MALVTSNDRVKLGSEFDQATDAQAAFTRFEPLITVDQVKERYLFGIPLVAFLPDPITKVRAQYTDDMLLDAIMRATNRAELEMGAGYHITPIEVTRRVPFDRNEYRSLGFFRLPDAPILRVSSLKVKTADGSPVYDVPLAWVDPGQFLKGQINVIPLMPAFIGQGGTLPSFDAGGAAWLSILGQAGWVASYWELRYWTGFEQGHIPVEVNELIGIIAAIDVLGKLAATYRISSYSLSLDAAGQSVSSPGPQLYDAAIARLEEEKKVIKGKLQVKHYKRIVTDNV
jgi:hypothetical protein